MPSQKPGSFIEGYLEYTSNSESPISYHTWSAIATIAGVLQRRVWMKWGHTEIYPNQYIVLIGPSGKARKGEPVMVCRSFLSALGIPLLAEDITREGMIQRIKNNITNYEPPGHGIKFQCSISCFTEELAVFLGEGDTKFLATLTNWYDSREDWTYETKHGGSEHIQGVCLNMLGSMADDWLPTSIPHTAIGGGFTSRILFIVEQDKGKIVPDPNSISIGEEVRTFLDADLERIFSITGEYVFSKEALEVYKEWYQTEEEKVRNGNPPVEDSRFSGYISRRATHIKKIAMALTASRTSDLLISHKDFTDSLTLLMEAEKNMAQAFGKVGKAFYTEQTKDVMDFIKVRGTTTRSELLRSLYQDVDRRALEGIEQTLCSMKIIEVDSRSARGEVTYTWKG